MNIDKLNRWQALDILGQCQEAMTANKFGTVCQLVGLNDDLAQGLTLEQVMQVVQVRLAEIAKRAGIDFKWGDK